MQFLFYGKPRSELRSHPDARTAISEEQAKVRHLYADGVFRQVWMGEKGVVAICEAVSLGELKVLLSEMPLLRAGFMEIELQELKPFPGFYPK